MSTWRDNSGKGIPSSPLSRETKDEINKYIKRRLANGYPKHGSYAEIDDHVLPPTTGTTYAKSAEIKEVVEKKHKLGMKMIENCLYWPTLLTNVEVDKLKTLQSQEGFLSSGQRAYISKIHKKLFKANGEALWGENEYE